MTIPSESEFEQIDQNNSSDENRDVPSEQHLELSTDPDYHKLLEHFQKGEKDLALMVLNTLEKRYPTHPELLTIKDELQMKASVKDLGQKIEKREKRENRKEFFRLAIFAVVGTALVMAVFYFTSQFLLRGTIEEQVDQSVGQLTSLQNQVEQLLDRGRPQPAVEILETMRGINPDWEALPELTTRTETLLQLEEDYEEALDLAGQGQNAEALALFQSIEETQPGLWDVRSQIAAMEAKSNVNTFLEQGGAAFQAGDWAGVISAYESAFDLDPAIDDPRMREQLIQAYINEISRTVEDQNASLEAVEQAEGYYSRAVALIPQGGNFSAQREQLEDLDDQIKELKYIRMARDIFADPFQTVSRINSAVSYLRQAANLNPRNNGLQGDLQNAEAYRDGFQSFVAMNWEPAIQNFNLILSSESGFLQGQARILLYESYYGLGKQYASNGQYGDAFTALEEAETLAFGDSDNLLKLFQVRVLIGDVFWQSGEPASAFSAYQTAFENIDINRRLEEFPETQRDYVEAINFAQNELFENAYENVQAVFDNIDVIYTYAEVTVSNSASLVFIANNNNSTIDAINQANGLPNDVVITFGGTLQVPMIEN
jgi:tetratricopeptide (TPR) repeat protein